MAWIEGRAADEREALDAAARLLSESRLTVLTGAAADVETVRALLQLGEIVGGIVDHDGFEATSSMLSALREAGIMLGAPAEMRRRADRWLLVGADPFAGAEDLRDWLFEPNGPDLGRGAGRPREVLHLGGTGPFELAEREIGDGLAQLRADLNGRRHRGAPLSHARVEEAASFLKGAAFGCVVFAPCAFGALDVELLCGLVEDLNRDTRFACLPVQGGAGGAFAAAQVATWRTGFPLRTAFGCGYPEFEPVLNAASRRVASGEATLALHVGGPASFEPDWSGRLPVIRIGGGGDWTNPPRIALAPDGRAGGRIVWEPRFGGFVAEESGADGTAGILATLAERLGSVVS